MIYIVGLVAVVLVAVGLSVHMILPVLIGGVLMGAILRELGVI